MLFLKRKKLTILDRVVKREVKSMKRELKLYAQLQNKGLKPAQALDIAEEAVINEQKASRFRALTRK